MPRFPRISNASKAGATFFASKSALFGGALGLGLAAWLLARFGVSSILALLEHAGLAGVLAVIAFHPLQMMFSAVGWREASGATEPRPRLRIFFLLRWIRESINNLLPLAQIGGEFVAARMLQRRGLSLATAAAGTLADLSLEIVSQVAFTVFGLWLLVKRAGHSGITGYVASGSIVAVLLITATYLAIRLGVVALLERALVRLGMRLGWAGAEGIVGMHQALMKCYRDPGAMARGALCHGVSWLLGGVEVWIILHFLGHDRDLTVGLIVESLGQALKAAGFAVPGAVGVQEGGYVVVCGACGLPAEVAIALSLMKRLREAAFGVPGLMLWQRPRTGRAAVS